MKSINAKYLTRASIIAAIYIALNFAMMLLSPLGAFAFGPIQVRISEALTVLPWLFAPAIPGLFVGCLLTNIMGTMFGVSAGLLDIVFGSLASLLAAYLSRKMPNKWLAPLPPVIVNAFVVAGILHIAYNLPYWPTVLSVGVGQAIACYALGMPLLLVLERRYKSNLIQ